MKVAPGKEDKLHFISLGYTGAGGARIRNTQKTRFDP